MGFRTGCYATVWQVEPKTATITSVRVSTSRKNKETGEYDQDFSGFVGFVGTGCASKASQLKERDRIKLGDVEVTNKYDKSTGKSWTNFNCYSFEMADGSTPSSSSGGSANQSPRITGDEPFMQIQGDEEGFLPF